MQNTQKTVEELEEENLEQFCTMIIAEALLHGQLERVGKDASHITKRLVNKINTVIKQEKATLKKQIREEIERMECPERCNSGHIFLGYSGEFGYEENWDACGVCVKANEYKPVVLKEEVLSLPLLKVEEKEL